MISNFQIPILKGQIKDARSSFGGMPFTNLDTWSFYNARTEQLDGLPQFTKDEEHVTMSVPYYHQTAGNIFILMGKVGYLIDERSAS